MYTKTQIQWYEEAVVTCACGNTFTVGAAKPLLKLDICNKCHPYFTGEMKYVDTLGRVEKFQKMQKKADSMASALAERKKKQKEKEEKLRSQKSLKEMLLGLR